MVVRIEEGRADALHQSGGAAKERIHLIIQGIPPQHRGQGGKRVRGSPARGSAAPTAHCVSAPGRPVCEPTSGPIAFSGAQRATPTVVHLGERTPCSLGGVRGEQRRPLSTSSSAIAGGDLEIEPVGEDEAVEDIEVGGVAPVRSARSRIRTREIVAATI